MPKKKKAKKVKVLKKPKNKNKLKSTLKITEKKNITPGSEEKPEK